MSPAKAKPTPLRLGLISDTHGYFDPALRQHFEGVNHILHAGDIGPLRILHQLEQIAPVTAVLGNNDFDPSLRDAEIFKTGGLKFLVHHIVDPADPLPELAKRLERTQPDIVVFGHTHKAYDGVHGNIRFINPGYAGPMRFRASRSVALLEIDTAGVHLISIPLAEA